MMKQIFAVIGHVVVTEQRKQMDSPESTKLFPIPYSGLRRYWSQVAFYKGARRSEREWIVNLGKNKRGPAPETWCSGPTRTGGPGLTLCQALRLCAGPGRSLGGRTLGQGAARWTERKPTGGKLLNIGERKNEEKNESLP